MKKYFVVVVLLLLWGVCAARTPVKSRSLAHAPHVTVKAANAAVPLALSIAPAVVVGGNQTTATITVSTVAPAGGLEITLRSLNSEVARFGGAFAAIGTSQLRISAGSVSATFPVRTFGVVNSTEVTLQALSGGDVASATVTVKPASVRTVVISPARVVGGVGATGTVTLDGIAPASAGVTVQLSVVTTQVLNNSQAASVPQSVIVAPGASSATFVVTTNPVPADASVNVLAGRSVGSGISDGTSNTIIVGESTVSSSRAVLTVLAPVASTLSLNPQSVPGGASSTGTVVLTGKAPAGGITLGLSARSASTAGSILPSVSDATVPLSINIPAGADRQDFQITTQAVGSPRTAAINVLARNNLQQISRDGSVRSVGSGTSDGTSNTVIVGGAASRAVTANLSITPSLTVTAQPSPATGGAPVAITLIVQPDPTGSASVALTTDHPELLQVPSTVAVPQTSTGLQRIIVNAPTNAASSDQGVTITVSRGSISASTTLLIKQTPPPLASFTLRPTTVTGGQNIIAQIALSSTAPNSVIVNLSTDHPELVTLPATVTVARSFSFSRTITTSPTTVPTTVTITAATGTQTISATVNVVP
jgi:hypothetical protein